METTIAKFGEFVRNARKTNGLTQEQLALSAGTGIRFIIDLEDGKPTCQLGKTLNVLNALGIDLLGELQSGQTEDQN